MVQLQQPFNAHAVQPQSRPEPIPDNWYPAIMEASDFKPTKDGNGAYLETVYTITDGEFRGRKMYDRLNLYNNSTAAVEIASARLSAICWCVGQFNISDTSQLHNIPLQIYVVKRKNERDGGYSNEVTGYRDANGNEPWKQGGGGGSQPQQQPQQPQGGGWNQQPQQPPQQPQQGGWNQPPQQPEQPAQGGWQQPPSGPPQGGNGGWQQPPQGQPQQPQGQPQGGGGAPQGGAAPWGGGAPAGAPPWAQK